MRRPPGPGLPFFAGLSLAIAASRGLELPPAVTVAAGFTLAAAAFLLILPPRAREAAAPLPWQAAVGAAALWGAVAGAAVASPWPGRPSLGIAAEAVRSFRAVALEDSHAAAGGGAVHRLGLRAVGGQGGEWAPASGRVRLFARGGEPSAAGQEVLVRGRLERLPAWDRDDFACAVGAGDLGVGAFGSGLLAARRELRERIELRARAMGYPVSAFFMAMFLGERAGVPEEVSGLFRDAGALHVLALSGTHLVLVFGIAAALARPLPWARLRTLLPVAAVAAYVAVVGPLPSVVRAAAMLGAALAARALDRSARGIDLVGIAGAAVLLVEPRMLFDLSFQLSALAVLGMVGLGPELARRLGRFLPRGAALALAGAAGAQVAVAPLLLATFGCFQPVGLVSGLVVAPCAAVLLYAGLAALALPLWVPREVHGLLGQAMEAVYRTLEGSLRMFGRFPQSRSWLLVAGAWLAAAAVLAAPLLRGRRERA